MLTPQKGETTDSISRDDKCDFSSRNCRGVRIKVWWLAGCWKWRTRGAISGRVRPFSFPFSQDKGSNNQGSLLFCSPAGSVTLCHIWYWNDTWSIKSSVTPLFFYWILWKKYETSDWKHNQREMTSHSFQGFVRGHQFVISELLHRPHPPHLCSRG